MLYALVALATTAFAMPSPNVLQARAGQYSGLSAYARISGAGVGHPNVVGNFSFITGSNGIVTVNGAVAGLNTINGTATSPSQLPPPPTGFLYHIHTNPIPSSGDCNAALGHLDPLAVGEVLACDPSYPAYCQLGDLAGRNGKLMANMSTVTVTYADPFLRFYPQDFSLLGRSVVIHMPVYPNLTRVACGNITSSLDGTANGMTPTNKTSNYVTAYPAAVGPEPTSYAFAFESTTTDTSVLAAYTSTVSPLPNSLPPVTVVPDVQLTSTQVAFNGSSVYAYAAASVSATSAAGSITAAAQFPSKAQMVPTFTGPTTQATANPNPSSGGNSGSSSSTPSSAAMHGAQVGFGKASMGVLISAALVAAGAVGLFL